MPAAISVCASGVASSTFSNTTTGTMPSFSSFS